MKLINEVFLLYESWRPSINVRPKMKDNAPDVHRLPIENFDARLSQIHAGWLFLGIWATIFLVNLIPAEIPFLLQRPLALALYFIALLAYPLVLVFVSTATSVTPSVQRLAFFSVVVFVAALFVRPADHSITDRWFSGLGLLALLGIQFAGAQALRRAEQQRNIYVTAFGTWLLFFLLPFFGIFFLHRRYQALAKDDGKPNFAFERTP